MTPRHQPASFSWSKLFKLILGIGLLVLAVWNIDIHLLWDALSAMKTPWLLGALVLVGLGLLLKALRWWLLLTGSITQLGPAAALGPLAVGQSLNMLTWARLGDVARIALVTRHADDLDAVPGITASVVAEKLLDLLLLALLGLLLVGQTNTINSGMVLGMLGVALLGLAGFAVGIYRGDLIAAHLAGWLARREIAGHQHLSRLLIIAASSLLPLRHKRILLAVLGLSGLIWAAAWAINLLLFAAAGLDLPLSAALLVMVLVYLGVAPGLMPTNVGPFYFLASLALTLYGVTQPAALAFAAVLHLMVTAVPLVVALLFLGGFRAGRGQLRQALSESTSGAR